jgi:D-alanyl-D-alanine carboxypeptidase
MRNARTPTTRRIINALVLLALAAVAAIFLLLRNDDAASAAPRPELEHVLDRLVSGRGKAAFGATAYVSGPAGTWLGAAGVADRATSEPMRPDARVRLESVSKIYTATLLVQLDQEHKLSLGDPLAKWLPGVLPYGNRITLRQLLTMTSGIVDNNDFVREPEKYLAYVKDAKLRTQLLSLARRIQAHPETTLSFMWWVRWAAWVPLLYEPGTQSHYSNIGYDLLGLVASRAGGKPFAQLYRERIFEPLDLRATSYDPQGPIHGQHAHGYAILENGKALDQTDVHWGIGAEGGIVSNARDTASFLVALMSGKLVDRSHLDGMKLDDLWLGGFDSGCAGRAYGWSGGGNGYKTDVWVNGDGGRVVVLLLYSRLRTSDGDALTREAAQELYCAA